MESLVLRGCGTALVTPFFADGSVDVRAESIEVNQTEFIVLTMFCDFPLLL